jgi:hypothetical protein
MRRECLNRALHWREIKTQARFHSDSSWRAVGRVVLSARERSEWTAREIDGILRSNEQAVARRLVEFAQSGLLREVPGPEVAYRYQPRTEALATAVAEAVERVVLVVISPMDEFAPFVYLVRLLAFGFIIAGLIDKNRAR